MRQAFAVVGVSGLLFLGAKVPPATAAGPWRAQIVDAETKQPLEGVVVVVVWWKVTRTLGGPSEEYHESQEVVTDQDGRFTIEARRFFSLNPLVFFRGPHFLIFKPGHGQAVWPGYEGLPEERRKALGTYARLLELEGIVLDMPRLRTLAERREYVGRVRIGFVGVPNERTPLLQKAIEAERSAVGYGG